MDSNAMIFIRQYANVQSDNDSNSRSILKRATVVALNKSNKMQLFKYNERFHTENAMIRKIGYIFFSSWRQFTFSTKVFSFRQNDWKQIIEHAL